MYGVEGWARPRFVTFFFGGEDFFILRFFIVTPFQVDGKIDVFEFSDVLFALGSNCFDEVADFLL